MCIQKQQYATSYKQKEKFVIIVVCCLHSIPSSSVDISDAFSMWHELAKKFEKVGYCKFHIQWKTTKLKKCINKCPNLPSICDIVIIQEGECLTFWKSCLMYTVITIL